MHMEGRAGGSSRFTKILQTSFVLASSALLSTQPGSTQYVFESRGVPSKVLKSAEWGSLWRNLSWNLVLWYNHSGGFDRLGRGSRDCQTWRKSNHCSSPKIGVLEFIRHVIISEKMRKKYNSRYKFSFMSNISQKEKNSKSDKVQ